MKVEEYVRDVRKNMRVGQLSEDEWQVLFTYPTTGYEERDAVSGAIEQAALTDDVELKNRIYDVVGVYTGQIAAYSAPRQTTPLSHRVRITRHPPLWHWSIHEYDTTALPNSVIQLLGKRFFAFGEAMEALAHTIAQDAGERFDEAKRRAREYAGPGESESEAQKHELRSEIIQPEIVENEVEAYCTAFRVPMLGGENDHA